MELFWQLASTFVLLAVEEMGIPLPFVTSSLMVALGLAWRAGSLPLWPILVTTASAAAVGSMVLYTLGRVGRSSVVDRILPRLTISESRRVQLEARLGENAFWAILGARFVPGLGPVASLLAGVTGVPVKALEGAVLAASTGWTFFWLAGGSLGYGILAPFVGWLPPRIQLPVAVFSVAVLLSLLVGAARAIGRRALKLISR